LTNWLNFDIISS